MGVSYLFFELEVIKADETDEFKSNLLKNYRINMFKGRTKMTKTDVFNIINHPSNLNIFVHIDNQTSLL